MIDWNEIIKNAVSGILTGLPIVLAFYLSSRGGWADAASKAGHSLSEIWQRLDTLEEDLEQSKRRYQILFSYLLENLEYMIKHRLKPLPPPDELKTDPELMMIIQRRTK